MRTIFVRGVSLLLAIGFLMVAAVVEAGCTSQSIYDPRTGRMTICTTCYDANGNPISTICT
jgi:cytochrome c553